jgi:hypothetical protein
MIVREGYQGIINQASNVEAQSTKHTTINSKMPNGGARLSNEMSKQIDHTVLVQYER